MSSSSDSADISISNEYHQLDPRVTSVAAQYIKIMLSNDELKKIDKQYSSESARHKAYVIHLLSTRTLGDFLKYERHVHKLICYNDEVKKQFQIESLLMESPNVYVLTGTIDSTPVVVKCCHSSKIEFELNIYSKLYSNNCQVPWFQGGYKILNQPVLVMARLTPIGHLDDPCIFGEQILNFLSYLHNGCSIDERIDESKVIGIHNDIKPGNVMRDPNIPNKYYLIDFGGVAIDKLEDGFHRKVWTVKWSSQQPYGKDQVTCARNDFLELGYTMNAMAKWNKADSTIPLDRKDIFNGFKGKIAAYMRYAYDLPRTHSESRKHHGKLRDILRGRE